MLRSWIYLILIMPILFGIYVFTDFYMAIWALLIIIALVISSILLLFVMKQNVSIKLASSWSTYQSEEGILEITIDNHSLFPITKMKCNFTFHNQLTNEIVKSDTYIMVNSKEKVSVPLHFSSNQIGRMNIKIDKLIIYDFLHLVGRSIRFNTEEQTTYIIPYHTPIQFIEKYGDVGMDYGMQKLNNEIIVDGTEMVGIREYEAGDNAKDIHWKLTPKFNFPIVKEFSEPVSEQILVVYDTYDKENVDAISTKIEMFLSLSTSLIDADYEHRIAWFEKDTEQMKQEDIYLKEQLIPLQTSILSIEHQRENDYRISDYIYQSLPYYTHIYIITSEENEAIEIMNRTSQVTILIYSEEKDNTDGVYSNDIFINQDTLQESVRYLMI